MSERKRTGEQSEHGEEREMKKTKTECGIMGMRVEPYLFFPGNCREALDFYVECFNGKVPFVAYYKDAPESSVDFKIDSGFDQKIMHSSFAFRDGTDENSTDCVINVADFPPGTEMQPTPCVQLSLGMSNLPLMLKIWGKFVQNEKTKVTMPMKRQFWGATYGRLVDPYGVSWMFSGPDDEDFAEIKG